MKISLKKYLCTAACLVMTLGFASLTHAQDNLENAMQAALNEHPSVESAIEALNASKAQRQEQFAGYFPEISVTGTAGRIYGDNSTSRGLTVDRGAAYSYLGEGSITMRQMLFDGLETPSRVEAAQNRRMSANANVFDVREALALRVAQSYINVLRSRQGLEMIVNHAQKVDDYLARIKNMVDEGASDESELQQARDIQVILAGIQADFEGQVMAAVSQFSEATGYAPQDVMAIPEEQLDVIPAEITESLSHARELHPSILAARLNAEAADADIMAEKGTLYPDVDGELSYLKSDKADEIGGEVVDARAVLRMNWNFSTGGAQLARIKRTKHAHYEALARVEEVERQIERDVRLAHSELVTSRKQLELSKKRRALNEKLFEAYEAQFEGARVNLLQLMQSHNQLFNTELEALNAKYRYLSAQYAMLASMGKLQQALNMKAPAQEEVADGGQ